jgi:hypothetical protein
LFQHLVSFPDERSLGTLQRLGVTYVVVHTGLYPADQRAALDERLRAFDPRLRLEYSDSADRVYSVRR